MTIGTKEDGSINTKRLPKEQRKIKMSRDGKHVVASLYEHPEGVRYWFSYGLSDLPNDDISREDLEPCWHQFG